jgi:hypothetical protein
LREEFMTFAHIPPLRRKACTPELLGALQVETFSKLIRIAIPHDPTIEKRIGWAWSEPIRVVETYVSQENDFYLALPATDEVAGDPRTLFHWMVSRTLSKIDPSRIRKCAVDCVPDGERSRSRLFWADHGNQWYCSARCANTARVRRYRAAREERSPRAPTGRTQTTTPPPRAAG